MHMEIVRTAGRFHEIAPAWNDLYAADPEAQVFLSHAWLRALFSARSSANRILVARQSRDARMLLGALPLRMTTSSEGEPNRPFVLGAAGGRFSDCNGLLCRPGAEKAVMPALASTLAQIGASRVEIESMLISDVRLRAFMIALNAAGFDLGERRYEPNAGINNCTAPYATLPADWNTFLNTCMSANSRQRARRYLRKLDAGEDDLSVTQSTQESMARDIDTLMRFWAATWAERKGELLSRQCAALRNRLAALAQFGLVDLHVLWRGTTPLAVHALYVDRVKRTLHYAVGGRDGHTTSPPPGFLLHCHSIRSAITEGWTEYDFLRGDEIYKFSFATGQRRLRHLVVSARASKPYHHAGERPKAHVPVSRPALAEATAEIAGGLAERS